MRKDLRQQPNDGLGCALALCLGISFTGILIMAIIAVFEAITEILIIS